MSRTLTTDSGLAVTLDVNVDDWTALGRHLAAGADDAEQVAFLLGFMESLHPMQAAYIATRVRNLPPHVADDLADTLRSLIP